MIDDWNIRNDEGPMVTVLCGVAHDDKQQPALNGQQRRWQFGVCGTSHGGFFNCICLPQGHSESEKKKNDS